MRTELVHLHPACFVFVCATVIASRAHMWVANRIIDQLFLPTAMYDCVLHQLQVFLPMNRLSLQLPVLILAAQPGLCVAQTSCRHNNDVLPPFFFFFTASCVTHPAVAEQH